MAEPATVFLALGAAFLLGLAADLLGKHTFLPRVTILILAGVAIGTSGLELLQEIRGQIFEVIADFALAMIGFLLGGQLERRALKEHGSQVLRYSLVIAIGTGAIVIAGLLLFGAPVPVALVLGAIAAATAPAASHDVVRELGATGEFPDTLLGIVAIDDVWGLILFSMLLAVAVGVAGEGLSTALLLFGLWEIFGALLIGTIIGLAAAPITGRIAGGEPTQAEALGVVLLAAGAALWLEASLILTAVTVGAVLTNTARHHNRPFHAIEGIEWPFLILFFLLAGATLDVSAVPEAGILLVAFVVLRVAGRLLGSLVAGAGREEERQMRRWFGPALLPQAGVAIGMTVVAANRLPQHRDTILTVALAATVIFEIVGPVITRIAVRRAGAASEGTAG